MKNESWLEPAKSLGMKERHLGKTSKQSRDEGELDGTRGEREDN